MNFRSAISAAQEAVKDADLPPDMKSVAFKEVLRAALAQIPGQRAHSPAGPEIGSTPSSTTPTAAASSIEPATRMSERVGIPSAILNRLFVFEAESARFEVAPDRLPEAKGPAAEALTLLACGLEQLAYGAEETSADAVRKICEEYGRYDEANFAYRLKKLSPEFARLGGTARKFTFKLTRPGIERLRRLILELAGEQTA